MEILDQVWMLIKDKEVCYAIGTSAKDVWRRVIEDETMGTGFTRLMLRKQGWRARRVVIGLLEVPKRDLVRYNISGQACLDITQLVDQSKN